jgi:hypothetical protein
MAAVENDTLLSCAGGPSGASGTGGADGADVIVMTITDDETGARYEGEVLASNPNCPHGKGKLTQLDGSFHDGEWKNGKKHGKGITMYNNGNRYEGEWDGDIRTRGTLTFANGNTYKGQFGILFEPTKKYPLPLYQYHLDGKSHPSPPNGYGIYTTATHVMEGLWKNDRAVGYFIRTNRSDGTKRSHFFRHNKATDEGVPLLPRYEEGCAICLDDFSHEMGQVVATCCNHYFHEKCICPAIQSKRDCPLCRTVVSKLKYIASCISC